MIEGELPSEPEEVVICTPATIPSRALVTSVDCVFWISSDFTTVADPVNDSLVAVYSVSRWSAEDGRRLRRHLELEFEGKKNRQIYWDDVALFCHPEEYELGILPMQKGDLLEIDDLSELIAMDGSYGIYAQGVNDSE